jgi:methylated-DNA-[protein]-cysteine S-methyltransferase
MTRAGALLVCVRRTAFGPVAAVWTVEGGVPQVLRVVMSRPADPADGIVARALPGAARSCAGEAGRLVGRVAAFLDGEDVRFALEDVRVDLCPPFQQRVLRAEHAIPRGKVSTYGRIAAYLGVPGGARAVGTALARNPFPIIVPCHRAVRSNRTLGHYQGGLGMKRALLEAEGIRFDAAGRVAPEQLYY